MLSGYSRYNTFTDIDGKKRFMDRANSGSAIPAQGYSGGFSGGFGGMRISGYSPTLIQSQLPLLENIIDPKNHKLIHSICRDIYYHNAIGGQLVDSMASLAFGHFSLGGIGDTDILKSYIKNIHNLRTETLLPQLATEFLVIGVFIASLNWDANSKSFTSIVPQPIDGVELTPVPLFGVPPLVTLSFSEDIVKIMQSRDPRMQKYLQSLPQTMRDAVRSRKVDLDPQSTLYLRRGTLASELYGISYYRRIIPIFLLEKALLRGTIDQAYRRQRAITVITSGDDNWEPSEEELTTIGQLVSNADMDPVSSILSLRQGINFSDLKRGDDFWKISDAQDFLNSQYLRALGASDSLISGDTTVDIASTAITFFLDSLRSFRDMVTRIAFYEKIFLIIAKTNRFMKPRNLEIGKSIDTKMAPILNYYGARIYKEKGGNLLAVCDDNMQQIAELEDVDKYWIPTIHWHRSLQPERDSAFLSYLQELQQLGFPITLATLSAAAGFSLEETLHSLDKDLEHRRQVAEYQKEIQAMNPQQQQAQARVLANYLAGAGSVERIGTGARLSNGELDTDIWGPFSHKKDGSLQRLSPTGRKVVQDKMTKVLSEALTRIAIKNNALREKEMPPRKKKFVFNEAAE